MRNTPSRREYLAAMGSSVIALGSTETAEASSTTVVVPDDQPTVQAGVDAVAPGGTVRVMPGVYEESVRVGKPVHLVGNPGGDDPGPGSDAPVLDGNNATKTSGVTLRANGQNPDDVTVSGFEIRNYGRRPERDQWGHGVAAGEDNDHVTVTDCRISDVGAAGISVSGGGENDYTDWTVERCQFVGAPLAGVRFDHVSDATIADNEFVAPEGFEEYPRFGLYLHANTTDGNSSTQSKVVVTGNKFAGDSGRAAVWLLAINKNDPSLDTLAALRDVTVADNVFVDMPESTAVAAAANSVRGAPTRLTGLTVRENTVRNARAGLTVESSATDGVDEVTVVGNDVETSNLGIEVSGHAPAAIGAATVQENAVDSDGLGMMVSNHERRGDTTDDRYAVRKVRVFGGTLDGGEEWGFAVHANRPHGVGSVVIEDVTASGKEGVHATGHAPDAIGSVSVSGGTVEGIEGSGLHVGGEADGELDRPALGTVDVVDVDVTGAGAGVALTADSAGAVGSMRLSGGTVRSSHQGVLVRARGAGAVDQVAVEETSVRAEGPGLALNGADGLEDAPSIGRANVDGVTVEEGEGVGIFGEGPDGVGRVDLRRIVSTGASGLRVAAAAPGGIRGVTVDGLSVDVSDGPGVQVVGEHPETDGDAPAVGSVAVDGFDLTTVKNPESEEGGVNGVVVRGQDGATVGPVDLRNGTVDADFVGVSAAAKGNGRVEELTVEDLDVVSGAAGVEVASHGGTFGSATVAETTVNAEWAGLQIHAHREGTVESVEASSLGVDAAGPGVLLVGDEGGRVDSVSAASLDVEAQAHGVLVNGRDVGSVGSVTVTELDVQSSAFLSNLVRSTVSGGVESVTFERCNLSGNKMGLFVWGEAADAVRSVDVTNSEVRDNDYGLVVAGPDDGPQRGDALTVRDTNVVGNSFRSDNEIRGFGVLNVGGGTVDARGNYWGSGGGPAHPRPGEGPSAAPEGATPEEVLENYPMQAYYAGGGDRVSEGVRYEPYLKKLA